MIKLVQARIVPPEQLSLFEGTLEVIGSALQATEVSWYGRLWRAGGVTLLAPTQYPDALVQQDFGRLLVGRLGFERSGITVPVWDERSQDFVDRAVPDGVVSPFMISERDFRIAFQTRGQDIQVSTFTAALRALLREGTGQGWRVETAVREATFTEWRANVERVTRLHFRAERPNPNYEDREEVQSIIEGLSLDSATFDFKSETGVNTDGELVRQLLDHTDSRSYGEAVAVGERRNSLGEQTTSVYQTELKGEAVVSTRTVTTPDGLADFATLADELFALGSSE